MFPKLGLLREESIFHVPFHIPEYNPDRSRNEESLPHTKLLDSFNWSAKSSYCKRKSPTVLPNWDS